MRSNGPELTVLQIAPEIAAGSGVGGVAHHLEQAWRAAGVRVERFTLAEAGGGWLPTPGPGVAGKLVLGVRVLWFSVVGSALARRRLARRPEVLAVCHNDVLAGDVYVNHGILRAAMHARGHYALRMVRNPLHLFTAVRDAWRYRSRTHRVVVSLTRHESALLQQTYPGLRPRPVVIGNGVDTERFRPPTATARSDARAALGIGPTASGDRLWVLFVGHEFGRKGLPLAIEALAGAEGLGLLVVGGTADMVADAARQAGEHGVTDRVRLLGPLADPRPAFWAADAFILPSAYEANALVVLEALACGLPVITTAVGYGPDIIVDGQNGWLVERTADAIRGRFADLGAADRLALAQAARASALPHAWSRVAEAYLDLLADLAVREGVLRAR